MNWHVVVFDLDNQPPGLEPQLLVAQRVDFAFKALGQPRGFAVFYLADLIERRFTFWFSNIAAPHFAPFIEANNGFVSASLIPDEATCIGDETTRDSL